MKETNNMTRQHENVVKLYTDEESQSSIEAHQLPTPIGWKVLVQASQVKTKTAGGIFLPSQSQDNEEYLTANGVLLSLGDLAYRDRDTGTSWKGTFPKAGDKVTYGKYAGQKVIINGVKLLLLNDDEITSIIPKDVEITAYVQ
mgnify:FL=1|jgi:chaperonin GroES|tara:strand:- start:275 stop:703 length:429 start_codon:yes stop_codon:yes gene_type:complete